MKVIIQIKPQIHLQVKKISANIKQIMKIKEISRIFLVKIHLYIIHQPK